jgi:hypothetical protein
MISESSDDDDMGMECSTHGEMRNKYEIQADNFQKRERFGRYLYRWEDFMKIGSKEIRMRKCGRICLAQDMIQGQCFANTTMNIRVP